MKTFIGFFLVLGIACSALATDSAPQKSFLEDVIEAMAKEYLKTFAKDAAMKQADIYSKQILDVEISGKVSTALSVYNLIQDIHAYDNASSDTQRYQAAAHAAADAITAANAAVGAIVQIGVLVQDLSAAYVSKDYSLEFAKMREEIIHLEKLRTDEVKQEYDSENDAFKMTIANSMSINDLVERASKQITTACGDETTLTTKEKLTSCYEKYRRYVAMLRTQRFLLNAALTFQGRFINVSSFMQDAVLKKRFDSYSDSLKQSDVAIASAEASAQELVQLISDIQMRAVQNAINISKLVMSCESKILTAETELLRNRKVELLDKSDWIHETVVDSESDLHDLINVTCKPVLEQIDPEILALAH